MLQLKITFSKGFTSLSFRSNLGKTLSITEKNNNATVNTPDWVKSDLTYRYLKKLHIDIITFFPNFFSWVYIKYSKSKRYFRNSATSEFMPFFSSFFGCRHIKSYQVVVYTQRFASKNRPLALSILTFANIALLPHKVKLQ